MKRFLLSLIFSIFAATAFADYSGPFSPTGPLAFTPATIVNPTDPAYGAKCDGVTDDTSALQSWANAVVATGAKGVLPVGTCLTTGLTIDVSAASLGIIIEGAGAGQSFIKAKSGSTAPVITYNGAHNGNGNQSRGILRDLTIDGSNTSSDGVYESAISSSYYGQGLDFTNVTIQSPGQDCLNLASNNNNWRAVNLNCAHPGRNGLTDPKTALQPAVDFQLYGGEFYGADNAGVKVSGAVSDGGLVQLTATGHGLPANPTFTATIAGTTLTVSAGASPYVGYEIVGAGVTPGTIVVSGSGTSFQVSISQTVSSGVSMTGYPLVMSYDSQGVTGAQGQFYASYIDANHVDLLGSTFGGTYTCCGRMVPIWTVTGMASDGGLIQVTTSIPHNLSTGAEVLIRCQGCGVPNSDGVWFVAVTGSTTFDLQTSAFAGTFVAGTGATARSATVGIWTVPPNQFFGVNVFNNLIGMAITTPSTNGIAVAGGEWNGNEMGAVMISSGGTVQPDTFGGGMMITGNSMIGNGLYPDFYLANTGGQSIVGNNFYKTVGSQSSYLVQADSAVVAPVGFNPIMNAIDQNNAVPWASQMTIDVSTKANLTPFRYSFSSGFNCLANGLASACIGYSGSVSGQSSLAGGTNANDNGERSWVFGGTDFLNIGDNQSRWIVLSNKSTSTTPVTLTVDRGAASSTNCLNVRFNYEKYFIPVLEISASIPTTTDWAYWKVTDLVLNMGNGVATTAISAANGSTSPSLTSLAPTASSSGLSTARVSLSADGTNGCLTISATGIAATTIDWNAAPIDGELR